MLKNGGNIMVGFLNGYPFSKGMGFDKEYIKHLGMAPGNISLLANHNKGSFLKEV